MPHRTATRLIEANISEARSEPLLQKVDSIQVFAPDLEAGVAFYERLGHSVVWKRPAAVGLRLPGTDAEVVVQTQRAGVEVDFLVGDADRASALIGDNGGLVIVPPFDIEIGRCAVVADPWENQFAVLDMRYGPLTS